MIIKSRVYRQSLYQQVADILRREILPSLQPGQRLPAETKLAVQLGVSVLTLRQALSALAQQGLIERRHGSGSYVAQAASELSVAIVTLLSESPRDASFQARLFRMVGTHFSERGYRVRHYAQPLQTDWSDFLQDVRAGRLAGAVFIAMNPGVLGDALDQKGLPFVVTADAFPHAVAIDQVNLIQTATRYLLERGCRKLALMQWEGGVTARDCEAFATVMAAYGAPVQEQWIRRAVDPAQPGSGWEQFREIWAARAEKPDGLLVTDDVILQDVALAILDLHIQVPGQLQIVAQTNKGSGVRYPFPVVALEIDPQEVATGLGEMLIKLMNRESVAALPRYIAPRLVLPQPRPVPAQPAADHCGV